MFRYNKMYLIQSPLNIVVLSQLGQPQQMLEAPPLAKTPVFHVGRPVCECDHAIVASVYRKPDPEGAQV